MVLRMVDCGVVVLLSSSSSSSMDGSTYLCIYLDRIISYYGGDGRAKHASTLRQGGGSESERSGIISVIKNGLWRIKWVKWVEWPGPATDEDEVRPHSSGHFPGIFRVGRSFAFSRTGTYKRHTTYICTR